jgi:DNA polymerase-3 subunit delta'
VSWHEVRGHDPIVAELRQSLAHGRLPHAFLFVGPEGIGKRTFALTLARALLCERNDAAQLEPCETCPSCLLVRGGTHPDLLEVGRPEDKHELPIRVIRDLCLSLSLTPMRGRRRIAIVDDADALNDEAANAFLKTLEEPPLGSVLILIATSAETQLETVVSRCRVVRFDPLAPSDLTALLLEQGIVADPSEADRLAQLAEGSVSRACGLADPELNEFHRELIDELANPRGFDPLVVSERIGAFSKKAGKQSIDQRNRASLIVGELIRFCRILLWQAAGLVPPGLDPADQRAAVALAAQVDIETIFALADRLLEADYQIQRKAYMPLILDALMHDVRRLLAPPRTR